MVNGIIHLDEVNQFMKHHLLGLILSDWHQVSDPVMYAFNIENKETNQICKFRSSTKQIYKVKGENLAIIVDKN